MQRVKGLYVREGRSMYPVYLMDGEQECIALGNALEKGEARVVKEYIQMGIETDFSTEMIVWNGRKFAVLTITPGGYLGGLLKQQKRNRTKAAKAVKGNG